MAKPKLSIASLGTSQLTNLLTKQQAAVVPAMPAVPAKPLEHVAEAPAASAASAARKLIGFRASKAAAREIERMAWHEELTVQALIIKTLNEYRRSKGLDPLPE